MFDILPRSMLRVKRGICPHCGLPLPLNEDAPTLGCAACGCEAVVERRLRTTEPEIAGAPLRMELAELVAGPDEAPERWVRSTQFRQGDATELGCPGCGVAVVVDERPGAVEIVHCGACGTDSRFERRVVRSRPTVEPPQPRRRSRDEAVQLDDTAEDDPESEHLIWRILNETDADLRVALALNLLRWRFVNRTVARFVPALLAGLHQSRPEAIARAESVSGSRPNTQPDTQPNTQPDTNPDPRLHQAVADALALLSNHGDVVMRDAVLLAAEPWMFRAGTSRGLIASLGLGAPVGLKLLLDSAQFATAPATAPARGLASDQPAGSSKSDDGHAAACLNAVNWLFQRNYEAHGTMGEVLLYRMLYLSGPTLAFALGVAQRRITGTGFHFDAATLLRFIDDAEAERPALVPDLERAVYVGRPADGNALRAQLELFHRLHGTASRAAALRHVLAVPEDRDEEACTELITAVAALLDDQRLGAAAGECLTRIVADSSTLPEAIHALVAARGDTLPAEFRRHYLASVPNSPHLDPRAIPYWTSPAPPVESPEFTAALARWKEALVIAVEADAERRAALTEFWSSRASSPEAAAASVWEG